MRATARLVAEADRAGRTALAVVRSDPPLLLRRTGARPSGPGEVEVHLVGGAAGPLGGDRIRLEVTVGPGAALCVRTVAASLALPDRARRPSLVEVVAEVGAGGRLRWLPEPLIAAAGCDHRTTSTVELAGGASLVWRDELVCGRHGEDPGDARIDLTVRYAGRTLLRHDLAVGPSAPGWSGPAVLAGCRATGSCLTVAPSLGEVEAAQASPASSMPASPDLMVASLPLVGPAVLVSAAATAHPALRRALTPHPARDALTVS